MIGLMCGWMLRYHSPSPDKTISPLGAYGGGLIFGGLLGMLLAALASLIWGQITLLPILALLAGMLVGALLVPLLPLQAPTLWQFALYGGGLILGGLLAMLLAALVASIWGSNTLLFIIATLGGMMIGLMCGFMFRYRPAASDQTLSPLGAYGGGLILGGFLALMLAGLVTLVLSQITLLTILALLGGMLLGALLVTLLPFQVSTVWQSVLNCIGGMLLGGALAMLLATLVASIWGSNAFLYLLAVLGGMMIGLMCGWMLRYRSTSPDQTLSPLVAYGSGLILGSVLAMLLTGLVTVILGQITLLTILALLGGMLLGALLVSLLPFQASTVWQFVLYCGGGMLLGALLLGGCCLLTLGVGGVNVDVSTPTPTSTITTTAVRDTLTPTSTITTTAEATPTLTLTPTVTATETPTVTATETPTATPSVTATEIPTATPALPPLTSNFNLVITASNESNCGYGGFTSPYVVTIAGSAITLFQADVQITSTGSYNSTTGAFSTGVSNLPGTALYNGTITFDDETITLAGTYTYFNDPNQACAGFWQNFGQTTP